MKVLVTGGGGYIGSVLTSLLLDKGYKVKVLDRFFFGREPLKGVSKDKNLEIIKDDIRSFEPGELDDVDVVIDLASLSNDPSGELNPEWTMDINYHGRVRVSKLAKKRGVKRYLLASSCSVYGFQEGRLTEEASPNPLTTYAKANELAGDEILTLSDKNFGVTVMRQATVYGLSPRMRFDLAVNGMCLGFYKNRKIPILRDGTQWRPFVHVKDTSRAFISAMEAELELVNGEIFNVGSNDQNYQIMPLAKLVAKSIDLPFAYEWYGSPDKRSYQVSFDKINKVLNFKAHYTPKEGAKKIYDALEEGRITDDLKTITVKWYAHLLEMQKLLREIEMGGRIL